MSTITTQPLADQIAKSALTRELIDALCEIVSHGHFYTVACGILKVNYITFQRWMKVGKADIENSRVTLYAELYERIKQADTAAEAYVAEEWRKHFTRDYHAAKDFMARRWPERWSERRIIDVQVDKELTKLLKELEIRLPPQVFSAVLSEIAAIGQEAQLESGILDDSMVNATDDQAES